MDMESGVDVALRRHERRGGTPAVLPRNTAPHRGLRDHRRQLIVPPAQRCPRRTGRRHAPRGGVVDAIVKGDDVSVVVQLATLIAVAVIEAGLASSTVVCRHASARLILDLRTAVFDHVQRMPIAFFTRTRTGALVSRLNNDVIGAQRAFSDTLSGVVSNLVTLTLTLVVMLSLSWQITARAGTAPCSSGRRVGWAIDWHEWSEKPPSTTRQWARR